MKRVFGLFGGRLKNEWEIGLGGAGGRILSCATQ
ncbi:conserved hypothetical protein, partial [delta proteobacterium NaphS2]